MKFYQNKKHMTILDIGKSMRDKYEKLNVRKEDIRFKYL